MGGGKERESQGTVGVLTTNMGMLKKAANLRQGCS